MAHRWLCRISGSSAPPTQIYSKSQILISHHKKRPEIIVPLILHSHFFVERLINKFKGYWKCSKTSVKFLKEILIIIIFDHSHNFEVNFRFYGIKIAFDEEELKKTSGLFVNFILRCRIRSESDLFRTFQPRACFKMTWQDFAIGWNVPRNCFWK